MRILLTALILASLLVAGGAAAQTAASPDGYWKTIDDDGVTPRSVVQLWTASGKVWGKIVKLYRQPDEERDPVCDVCEGGLKNKRVVGMQILNGLTKDGDEWAGGTILDPKNGKSYKCYIALEEGGAKLKVRGFIGFSLLGRTQYWQRTTQPSDEIEVLPRQ